MRLAILIEQHILDSRQLMGMGKRDLRKQNTAKGEQFAQLLGCIVCAALIQLKLVCLRFRPSIISHFIWIHT